MKQKVVLIGGGTGLSAMMMGLKNLDNLELSGIVTVADSGGSTGRLRDLYNIPAMGDIRHVLSAMAMSEDQDLFANLMNFRFDGVSDIGGHNLGNLIFLALTEITGSFVGAIEAISHVLNVKGRIYPSTLDVVTLYAMMADGTLVRGEDSIPKAKNHIDHVFYQQRVQAYRPAIEAIDQADLILYGTGSLYTSIMPNLIIPEMVKHLQANPCPKVYFCNVMSQQGETDGYSVEDHITALEKHAYVGCVDSVVYNQSYMPQSILDAYAKEGSYPIQLARKSHPYETIGHPMVQFDAYGRVRHNPEAVCTMVKQYLERMK